MTRSTTTSKTADPGGAGPAAERPIVVGIDGSAGSTAALRWAAAKVWRHGRPLAVICVVAPPAYSGYPIAPVPALDEALMAGGEAYLEEALAAVFGDNRPAEVRRDVRPGNRPRC
jgi:nucleotide-binding universal stress UspA family protein